MIHSHLLHGGLRLFGENANIFEGNFLELKGNYDYVIGNPPYNCNGIKKVPTNSKLSKKRDGQTIWIAFIRHSIKLLRKRRMHLWKEPNLDHYLQKQFHCQML